MWRAGIADVEVIRTSTIKPGATLGRIYSNDTVYTGDTLSINAIPTEGYTVQPYNTEIIVGREYGYKFIEIETEQTTPTISASQEIVLPTGDMIATSVSQLDDELYFDSDTNLQVLFDGCHWGYNRLDLQWVENIQLPRIHLYDYNLYNDEEYQSIMGTPALEYEYITNHGRYLGTLIVGDGEYGVKWCWYLTYDSELKND
jgi:hypothetical protein